MNLPSELIMEFAKLTANKETGNSEATVYGTVVEYNGSKFVKLDGSDQLTPVTSTAKFEVGERVTVMIKNHTATVTGNVSSPSASSTQVDKIGNKISDFEIVIAGKVDTIEFDAQIARINTLETDNVTIKETLTANEGRITDLEADNVTINGTLTAINGDIKDLVAENVKITDNLKAANADIDSIQADNVVIKKDLNSAKASIGELIANDADIEKLVAKKANIDDLKATNGEIVTLKAKDADIEKLVAKKANIDDLKATNGEIVTLKANDAKIEDLAVQALDAVSAEIEKLQAVYATIDFANIDMAAVEKLFTDSGIIKNLIVDDGKITGELVAVTINGDLIKAGTLQADKLVVKGEDGLYYKLNFESGKFKDGEEIPDDGIHGNAIIAKSVTAEKIAVSDLVAFGATIGGFNIGSDAIYSGAKASSDSEIKGIYLDNEGQLSVGDATNYIKYHKTGQKDTSGNDIYKLEISAESIKFGSGNKSIEDLGKVGEYVKIGTIIDKYSDGKNLIKNSNFNLALSSSNIYSRNGYATLTKETGLGVNGNNSLKIVTSKVGASGIDIFCRLHEIQKGNTYYVFSGYIKSDSDTTLSARFGYASPTTGYTKISIKAGNSWKKFTMLLYCTEAASNSANSHNLGNFLFHFSTVTTVHIANIKLEEGFIATDWTIAPEENEQPCVTLGEDDTGFKQVITNTSSIFLDGKNASTVINKSGVKSSNVTVTGSIVQGRWIREARANGNLGLKWVGPLPT